jgi:hypothetical protein
MLGHIIWTLIKKYADQRILREELYERKTNRGLGEQEIEIPMKEKATLGRGSCRVNTGYKSYKDWQ